MIELSKHRHKNSHLTKEKLRWLYNQMGAQYDVYSNQKEHKFCMDIMVSSNNSFFFFFNIRFEMVVHLDTGVMW